MLANRDILACAPTGSGKTFSFILPLLALNPPSSPSSTTTKETNLRPKAIVIEPTRELAIQVLRETKRLIGSGGWKVGVLGEEGIGSVRKEQGGNGKKRKGKKGNRKGKEKKEPKTDSSDDEDEGEEEVEQVAEVVDTAEGTVEEPYLGPIGELHFFPVCPSLAL
jgi:ATP-dependent RNA helicase DDX52/ROK1